MARHVRALIKHATKARHRQHKHAAMVLNGSNTISIGWNHSSVHAEHAAINRAWRTGTAGATMVVIRIRKDGSVGMSRPCEQCVIRLINAGIKKVVYSDNDGSLKAFKLSAQPEVNQHNATLQNILWYKRRNQWLFSNP